MDALFSSLSRQGGPFATLSVILLIFLVQTIRLLLAEKDKRIEEAIKTRDNLIEPIGFIKDSLSIIKDKVTISKEAQR